jgi:hypothetical protein
MPDAVDLDRSASTRGPTDYRWLHALNALLLLGLWVFAIGAYGGLPDEVPAHIGLHGVTRWVPKQGSPWFLLPIMTLVHVIAMYGMAAVADAGVAGFNVPSKKRLLALSREGQRYAVLPMRGFLYGLATWVLVLTGYIQLRFYAFALRGRDADGSTWGMLAFVAGMLAFVVFMGFRVSRTVARRIEAWEQLEPAPATGARRAAPHRYPGQAPGRPGRR